MNHRECRGMWLGEIPEGEVGAQKVIHDAAYNQAVERVNIAIEIADFVVPHQATDHTWVALNRQQFKQFMRRDVIGGIFLPDYTQRWLK